MAAVGASFYLGGTPRSIPWWTVLVLARRAMADVRLELWRDAGLDEHGHVRGYLWVKKGYACLYIFYTVERGHKFVRLRPRTYTMEHSTLSHWPDVQCLRPVGLTNPQLAACLIHPITDHVGRRQDSADVLEGCIAPFLMGAAEVPGSSKDAMAQLWRLLGGYAKGKQVTLVVLNDVPAGAL